MSVCISIKTNVCPEPEEFLESLADQGEGLIVTRENYPSVHFGNAITAIRGIEVNKKEDGLEVRVGALSSRADYKLFVKTILVISELTHGSVLDEDDEEIPDVENYFDDEWINDQRMSGIGTVCALVKHSGKSITIFGLFAPIVIGPKLLKELGISIDTPVSEEDADTLEDHLCQLQWNLGTSRSANTMQLSESKDESTKPLLTSVISVKDGEVCDFDYLPACNLLAIINMDENCDTNGSIIPIEEAWKVLPQDVFRPLDETQYEREGEVTIEMVNDMKEAARRYQNDKLGWRPSFPGHGLDTGQNTYILMWNPDISSVSLEEHNATIPEIYTEYFNWSVWEHQRAGIGDHFYLVRCGKGNTGIVMSGVFDSKPYQAEDWSGRGRTTYYMDMIPNLIIDPDAAPMITTEELQEAIPSFDWTGGHSGRLLTGAQAAMMEKLWAKYLDENKDKADRITMSYMDRERL